MTTTAEAMAPPRDYERAPGKSKVALTPTSWSPEATLGMREWADHGHRLGVIGRGAGWWIGDWVRYGNDRFGERYVRASRITGYDIQTLMNMVYVASRFPSHERRESLSWSHHAELAAAEPQERVHWLDHAEQQRLSVRCLREEIRRHRRTTEAEIEPATAGDEAQASGVEAPAVEAPAAPTLTCPQCGCQVAADAAQAS